MYTFDKATKDSAGAFLVGELERLDTELHLPLHSVSWQRDIDLREDVTMGDETSSYTVSSFAAAGGVNPTGKNFIAGTTTTIPGIAQDIGKFPLPLHLWGMELGWTLPELVAAQKVGRPIDTQKYEGMKIKHNMDIDEMVYVGDDTVGAVGLVNNPAVAPANSTLNWDTATPDQILADINGLVERAWEASGYAVCPDQLRLPPRKYGLLTKPVTAAGSVSILEYVSKQCLSNSQNGRPLEIHPLKWLTKRGVGSKDRMAVYTRNKQYVRFPLVPLQKTPLEARGIWQLFVYFGKLGHVEFVYPETVAYCDGI